MTADGTDGADAKFGSIAWLLHAFATIHGHFHLALETPRGNLAEGMQWLESAFANRFNRLRDERGHLFQSRDKALLVEPGDALDHVGHCIHLNPVRAGLVSVGEPASPRHPSDWHLHRPDQRPPFLRIEAALTAPVNCRTRAQGGARRQTSPRIDP